MHWQLRMVGHGRRWASEHGYGQGYGGPHFRPTWLVACFVFYKTGIWITKSWTKMFGNIVLTVQWGLHSCPKHVVGKGY